MKAAAAWVLIVLTTAFPTCVNAHPHVRDVEESLLTGDFHERIRKIAEHLRTENSESAQCELGSELWVVSWEHRRRLGLLDDETIDNIVNLVWPANEGRVKCLTSWAAGVIELIGPRAKAAVPRLETALTEARIIDAAREKSPWNEINTHLSLSETIRSALKAIDGRPR